jgi:hypothetical protein
MMNPNTTVAVTTTKPAAALWPKVLIIFAGSFLLFFALFFGYDLLTGFAERSLLLAAVADQTAPIVIDPKIADELAKVLVQDESANVLEVSDPFIDRAGLSATVTNASFGGSTVSASTAGGSKPNSAPGKIQTITGAGGITSGGNSSASVTLPVDSTKQRYDAWLGQAAINPDLKLDPRIFSIADLLPVGIVDGGVENQEVMFISKAAGKTVSFPVGTLLYDGWLREIRPEGVVFAFNDGLGTIRMHSWTRANGAGD